MHSTRPSMITADRDFYIESSLPPGITLGQYRRSRARRPVRRSRARLVRLVVGS
jgi:hypothetical protein